MDDFIDGGDETEGHHDDGYAEGDKEVDNTFINKIVFKFFNSR